MKNPCKDCQMRRLNCHSTCEQYHAWKKQVDERREAGQKYAASESMIHDGRYRGWKKNKMK